MRDCLSRFSVMGWSAAPVSTAEIEQAVDAYLATVDADRASQRRALQTLRDCYGPVVTRSGAGDAIRGVLAARLRAMDGDRAAA